MRRARATQRCCSVTGALVVLTALLSCASLYAVIATSSSVFRTRPGLAEVIKHDGRREMDTSTDRARKSSLTSDGVSMRPVHYAMPTGHPASPVAVAFQLPSDAPQDWGAVQPKQPLYGEKSDTSQAAPRTLPLPIISQPVTEAGGTSVETAPPLLIIGIPSVGRAGDANYLLRTLCYIESQLRERLAAEAGDKRVPHHSLSVRVIVMDNGHGRPHPVFELARRRWCPASACESSPVLVHTLHRPTWAAAAVPPASAPEDAPAFAEACGGGGPAPPPLPFVWFVQNAVPAVGGPQDPGDPNVPGSRVRQQTLDVVELLQVAFAIASLPSSDGATWGGDREAYYMFQEDDFRLCPRGVDSLAYGIAEAGWLFGRASRALAANIGAPESGSPPPSGWNALRVSFGLNGLVLPLGDVPALAAYYREHVARRPPDHMVVEWYAGERPASAAHKAGRPHVAFRYNLLEHFGAASSLRDGPPAPVYAFCYDELDGGVVFDVEAFQRAACGHAFVHPCVRSASLPPPSGSEPLPGIPFDELSARAREDSVQTWAPHPPPKPPRG